MSGTGIDVVPNFPGVRYRYESLYRYRRHRYPYRTEVTQVSGIGIDVSNLTVVSVTGIACRTELTAVFGTGNTGGMPRHVRHRTYPCYSLFLVDPLEDMVPGVCCFFSALLPAVRASLSWD